MEALECFYIANSKSGTIQKGKRKVCFKELKLIKPFEIYLYISHKDKPE